MATLLPIAEQQFCDGNGAPLVGGKVFFYTPNTTQPKDTFQDPAGTIKNPNPVILDAAGRAVIYGVGAYQQVLKDADDNVIWNQPTADTSSAGASWAGTSTGSPNVIALTAPNFSSVDGQAIDFIAGYSNTGAFYATVNGLPIPVKVDTVSGPVTSPPGAVTAGNRYRVTYDGTAGLLHLTPVVDRGYVDSAVASAVGYAGAQALGAVTQAENFASNADAVVASNAAAVAAAAAGAAQSAAEVYAAQQAVDASTQAKTFAANADAVVTSNCNATAQGYATAAKTAAESYSDSQLAAAQAANASTYVQGMRISGVYTPGLPYSRSNGQVVVYVNFSPNSLEVGNIQYNLNGTWVNVSG